MSVIGNQRIKFNVGGREFTTTMATVTHKGDNFISRMVINHLKGSMKAELDERGSFFIDRDGDLFAFVLDFFRTGVIRGPIADVQRELDYFSVAYEKVNEKTHILKYLILRPEFSANNFTGYSYRDSKGSVHKLISVDHVLNVASLDGWVYEAQIDLSQTTTTTQHRYPDILLKKRTENIDFSDFME
jgi:hypothetical protein